MSQISPVSATLVHEWQAEAKKHALAALDGDCEVGDEEWCLHRESARIYRKCADQLEAILTASHAQWQLPPSPHVEYVAARGQSKVTYWVSREEGDRIRTAALSDTSTLRPADTCADCGKQEPCDNARARTPLLCETPND